jgi:hypothetical protein
MICNISEACLLERIPHIKLEWIDIAMVYDNRGVTIKAELGGDWGKIGFNDSIFQLGFDWGPLGTAVRDSGPRKFTFKTKRAVADALMHLWNN